MFIQFPNFTYIKIGGFEEEPMKLPRHTLDYFVLDKIYRKLGVVVKRFLFEDKWDNVFLDKIGKISCKNMENSINIGCDLCTFDFKFYKER